MAQTQVITLTTAGADTGPFDLYSNIDGFASPFESNISKLALEIGYTSTVVPDSATTIRVQSDNVLCNNFIDLAIPSTTTTSTTSGGTTTTTTTVPSLFLQIQLFESVTGNPTWEVDFGGGFSVLTVLGDLSSNNDIIGVVSSITSVIDKIDNDGFGPNGFPTSPGSVMWFKNGLEVNCVDFDTSSPASTQGLDFTFTSLVSGDVLRVEVHEDGTSC